MNKPSTSGRWRLSDPLSAARRAASAAVKLPAVVYSPPHGDPAGFQSARNTCCQAQPSPHEGRQTFQSVPTGPSPLRPMDKCQEHAHWAGGWMWSLYVTTFTGIAAVSTLLAVFIVCLRPVLKSIDEACKATEEAAGKLEVAAEELEQAAIVFEEDLPPTLQALEHASREFEDLGQSLNTLRSGFALRRSTKRRRKRRRPRGGSNGDGSGDQKDTEHAGGDEDLMLPLAVDLEAEGQAAMEAITKQTMGGISKVASDLNHMTRALVPAMDKWRIRLLNSVTNADSRARGGDAASQTKVAEADSQEGRPEASPGGGSASLDWISGWQGKPRERDDMASTAGDDHVEAVVDPARGVQSDDADDGPSMSTVARSKETEHTTAGVMDGDDSELQDRREVAMEVLDALLRAERAAQDAANASGDLQQAVWAAQEYGAFDDVDTDFSGDSDALPTVMAVSPDSQSFDEGDDDRDDDDDDDDAQGQEREANGEDADSLDGAQSKARL